MTRKKNLSARIAEQETAFPRAKNRAAFLAVRDEVSQALEEGWWVKAIWRTLRREKKIDFGYDAFRIYVNRLVVGHRPKGNATGVAGKNLMAKNGAPGERSPPNQEASENSSTPELLGFKFNRIPKKEDLF